MKRIGYLLTTLTLCITLMWMPLTACAETQKLDCYTVMSRIMLRAEYHGCTIKEGTIFLLPSNIYVDGIVIGYDEDGYTLTSVFVSADNDNYEAKCTLAIDAIENSAIDVGITGTLAERMRYNNIMNVYEAVNKSKPVTAKSGYKYVYSGGLFIY